MKSHLHLPTSVSRNSSWPPYLITQSRCPHIVPFSFYVLILSECFWVSYLISMCLTLLIYKKGNNNGIYLLRVKGRLSVFMQNGRCTFPFLPYFNLITQDKTMSAHCQTLLQGWSVHRHNHGDTWIQLVCLPFLLLFSSFWLKREVKWLICLMPTWITVSGIQLMFVQ